MNDVALAAGVSLKTVSRVVNGGVHVRADKLDRVQEAIRSLGFRRNEYARQLRQGTSATIGLVLEDVADPFYSVLTRAVEDVAWSHATMLLTSSSAEDPARARSLIESFGARGVDGLIVAPAEGMDTDFLQAEAAAGCSMVFVDRPVPGISADTVLADNKGGAHDGTAHLLKHGHRRIAYFGDEEAVYTADERRAGHLSGLAAAGIPQDDDLIVMASPGDENIAALVQRVLALDDPPTAIFGGNNRWSIRLLRELRTHPKRADLAFIGFDDFELGELLSPGITVIAQNPAAMGTLAAELLFRRLEGEELPSQRVQLGTTLIPRGSGELPGPFPTQNDR